MRDIRGVTVIETYGARLETLEGGTCSRLWGEHFGKQGLKKSEEKKYSKSSA